MGLLYIMPVSEEEGDRVSTEAQKITLKSYGLPYIFWGYLAATLMAIFFLYLASSELLIKMIRSDDLINQWIAIAVKILVYSLPLILLSFFFYEKRIVKTKLELILQHYLFFIPVWQKKIFLDDKVQWEICSFEGAPNMAKMKNTQETRGFQNKGYFQLKLKTLRGEFLIDRHSRKADLQKLLELICRY